MMEGQAQESVLDYDAIAKALSEKFNVKNWKEFWNMAQKKAQEKQELLPPIDDTPEEEAAKSEMLPPIDDDEQGGQPAQPPMGNNG